MEIEASEGKPGQIGTLADEIIRRRKKLGLSIEEAAEIAGMELPLWIDLEANRRSPTVCGLFSIAKALQCKPGVLL